MDRLTKVYKCFPCCLIYKNGRATILDAHPQYYGPRHMGIRSEWENQVHFRPFHAIFSKGRNGPHLDDKNCRMENLLSLINVVY